MISIVFQLMFVLASPFFCSIWNEHRTTEKKEKNIRKKESCYSHFVCLHVYFSFSLCTFFFFLSISFILLFCICASIVVDIVYPPHLLEGFVPLYWCDHSSPPSLHISFAPLLLHRRRSTPVSTASSNLLFVVVFKLATTRWDVSRKWSTSLATNHSRKQKHKLVSFY